MSEDIPRYRDSTDSEDSDDDSISSTLPKAVKEEKPLVETYDDEFASHSHQQNNSTNADSKGRWYHPVASVNLFTLSSDETEVLVCLQKNEQLMLCGQFNLQIVKGGITYNNVHYNSSWRNWEFWHPVCNAVSAISSSFYAGWESKMFLGSKYDRFVSQVHAYDCVLRISNGCNISELTKTISDLRDIWGLSNNGTLPGFTKNQLTFNVLREPTDSVRVLTISTEWAEVLDELRLFHANSSQDMRVIVIGGKNSGKSTFMRLLLQKFLHSAKETDEIIHYLDIDPGQPEYSSPDSISWSKVDSRTMSLGQHLCQGRFQTVKQYYLGSSTPQDMPTAYSDKVEALMREWQDENFMGTSLLNIPGWIKGFGIQVINHALEHYKPTHVVFLSHNGRPFSNEILVPHVFSTSQRQAYKPIILQLHSPPSDRLISHSLERFNAAKIRKFKTTAYLHKKADRSYITTPLLIQAPLRISIGNGGAAAFKFLQHPNPCFHEDDIKLALDGTVIALYRTGTQPELEQKGPFPMVKNYFTLKKDFIGLCLIHSINTKEHCINIYVPESVLDFVKSIGSENWIIVRGKTETPIHELYPCNKFFPEDAAVPYVSPHSGKRNEHVWKVRKNVLRRGHHGK